MKYNWQIKPYDKLKVTQLIKALELPAIIAKILSHRPFQSTAEILHFFNPQLKDLYDPFLMQDMQAAVARLYQAQKNREKVTIFGDYDVDGTTATALLYLYFKEIGIDTTYYIPNREREGYGLSKQGIDWALAQSSDLIITCDCGINAGDKVAYAHQQQLDVIITDHHEVPAELPPAVAILDPKRPDDNYPFKELSGVGVAFKLLQGFVQYANLVPEQLFKHLDLVALGTAADIVPIIDENRIFAAKGLEYLAASDKIGIQSLLKIAHFNNKPLRIVNIVFGLAPRLNAAGRLEEATRSVRLLTAKSRIDAEQLAASLDRINRERRTIEKHTLNEAILQLNATHDLTRDRMIILSHRGWHQGVIGIVASKLKELYNRPVLMIAIQEGIGKGSARSIPGFDMHAALTACHDLFDSFGGHKMAAGLTIAEDRVGQLREALQAIAARNINDAMLTPRLEIDGEVSFEEINRQSITYLNKIAPYGPGNMRPLLVSRGIKISGMPRIVGENHLKFKAFQNNIVISAIGWRLAELYEMLISNRPLDIAYVVEENQYRGIREIQLNIKDIHYADK